MALHNLISSSLSLRRPGVLACSALKVLYGQQLLRDNQDVQLVYLKGSYDLIWPRMSSRKDHNMKPHMLQSQFATLEEPSNALAVGIASSVDKIIQEIVEHTR